MRLTIMGAPRTKKNSMRVFQPKGLKHPKLMPSKQSMNWTRYAVLQLRAQCKAAPIESPVNVRATFYRDALRGDAVGYYQALADALEEAGVVADDKWIVSWDGTRLAKDAKRPRVELVIEVLEPFKDAGGVVHPYEELK